MLIIAGFILFAYLLGSVSSAIIISKIMRLPDPREQGSGNPGATNVLRLGGKKAAIATLAGDILKGVIPVLVATLYDFSGILLASVAFAAFIGHLFPIFFGFKGGKGVATGFGAVTMLAWQVGIAMVATWLVVAFLFRYSSLAALVAFIAMPIYAYYLSDHQYVIPLALMALIMIIRHRSNIGRLLKGKESKIKF